MRESGELIATKTGIENAFKRGRCTAQNNRHLLHLSSKYSKVAGRITQTFLLFVRKIMLFINNNDAGFVQWNKNSRTCANNNSCFTLVCRPPAFQSFCVIEAGVHQHYWNLEAVLKTGHGLRGKPDFWHQDQGLFTLFENMVNDMQVNFSFAAACNAV